MAEADAAAAAAAAGKEPEKPKYEFSTDLNCGECISRGYNFCWRIEGVEQLIPGTVLSDPDYPKFDYVNFAKQDAATLA